MRNKLFLALLFAMQTAFAQIISKDPSFASAGIHSLPNNSDYWSEMVQNPDGSIYFTYRKINISLGLSESFLSKFTANGVIDSSFGTNGEIQLPHYANDSHLKKQSDGKLLVLGLYNSDITVTRILPHGQIDTSFGVGGTATIPNLGYDANVRSYGMLIQNDKILVHGIDSSNGQTYQHRIYRLNATGNIDNTFGNNGSVFTQGTWSVGSFVLLDNQLRIVSMTSNTMEKFDYNGLPLTNFGNNGILQLTAGLGYAGAVYMDSNNRIIYSNINHEIFRINLDGTVDTTFNYDLYAHSGVNGGAWILSILEKGGFY